MKNILRNSLMILLMVSAFMMNVSCPQNGNVNMFLGVGREVDEKDPVVTITHPVNGGYMPQSDVTISGTFSDNIGVTKIHVLLKAQSSDDILANEVFFDGERSGNWSVSFRQSDMEKLNVFSVNGTKVVFTVTAYDAMDNHGFESLFLYVDTEMPEVQWQKPDAAVRFTGTQEQLYRTDRTQFDRDYSIDNPIGKPAMLTKDGEIKSKNY